MTDQTKTPELKPCPFEKAKWRGESSNNPQKGWIINGHGNRITKLGNRNALGKLIGEHNKEIDLLKSKYIFLENDFDDYKYKTRADVAYPVTKEAAQEALNAFNGFILYANKTYGTHPLTPHQETIRALLEAASK